MDESVETSQNPGPEKHIKVEEVASIASGAGQGTASKPVPQKLWRVLVIRDSLLGDSEALICHLDNLSREMCCLPGTCVKDFRKALLQLI